MLWRTKSWGKEPLFEFGADSLIPELRAILIPNGHHFSARYNGLSFGGLTESHTKADIRLSVPRIGRSFCFHFFIVTTFVSLQALYYTIVDQRVYYRMLVIAGRPDLDEGERDR